MIPRSIIFTIFIAALILTPVTAYTYTFSGETGKAISVLSIESPLGTSGTFQLIQGSGDVISGSWSYEPTDFTYIPFQAAATIGSGSTSFTYITPGSLTLVISPLSNVTNSNTIRLGMGQTAFANTIAESSMTPSPIIGYSLESDNEVTTNHILVPYDLATKSLNQGDKSTDQLWSMLSAIYGTITGLIYWLKFLFVDNLVLVITLYFTGTMAYAANTSRNIFVFYKTWFRQQAAMFRFIAEMISTVYTLIIQAFNAVTKWF